MSIAQQPQPQPYNLKTRRLRVPDEEILAVYEICEDLMHADTREGKEDILSCSKHQPGWFETLRYLFDPSKVHGIAANKLERDIFPSRVAVELERLSEVYEYLEQNPTGRDIDVEVVQLYINKQPEEFTPFLYSLFSKKLRLGITVKTLNMVYGKDFIPQMGCMLAQPLFDRWGNRDRLVMRHLNNQLLTVTLKLDGIRCLATRSGVESVTMMSRQAKAMEGFYEIEQELRRFAHGLVLDGELLCADWEYMVTPALETYKRTCQVARKKGPKNGVVYWVFDVPSYNKPYAARRELLESIFESFTNPPLKHIKLLPIITKVANKVAEDVPRILEGVLERGQEGIMLNVDSATYAGKLTRDLIKVKQTLEDDLRVIGFEEGTGRLTGTLGAIVCSYKGGEVRVGSRLTDDERAHFWRNQQVLLNKVVTVLHSGETCDSTGQPSLRFPRYLRFRKD